MTQIFTETGEAVPVTVVEAGPAIVTQVKTVENDGYNAVQIGYCDIKEQRLNKPAKGHFLKLQVPFKKYLTEFRVDNTDEYQTNQAITVEDFEIGKKLDVTGVSKGKGMQGSIKRHGHSRGRMTHGSKFKRARGSLGASSFPARVFKGMKMAGHMGHETVTVQNVELVKIIPERNIMLIKGAVPGPKGGLLRIQNAVKCQNK